MTVLWVPDTNDGDFLAELVGAGGSYVARASGQVLWGNSPAGRVCSAGLWRREPQEQAEWWREWGWAGTSPVSPGSYAASLVKRLFPEALQGAASYPPHSYRTRFVRDGIYGGRCEVYARGLAPVWVYDIKAAYPTSCMLTRTYSSRLSWARRPSLDLFGRPGIALVVYSDSSDMPYLPWRSTSGRVFYPKTDHASGVYTHAELSAALELGNVTIHRVVKQYEGLPEDNPLRAAMEWFLEQRELTGDKVWKACANALIGRMAATEAPIVVWKGHGELRGDAPRHLARHLAGQWVVGKEAVARIARDQYLAADVLSYARRALYWSALAAGESLVYVDTDAIHCSEPVDRSRLCPGYQWGEEQHVSRYHGIKLYKKDEKAIASGRRNLDAVATTGRGHGPHIVVEDELMQGGTDNAQALPVGIPMRRNLASPIRASQRGDTLPAAD